ncbi:MAG: cation diffusion facilitator family transporter [Acidimicrobiaceae bacterium]|nr:cation diffusion facilitator family transporter [Acidimicrobiaceae bacterium]MYI54522.1 cation diffusion facilitator family transporter [Acidimicrobiaceae bacterium]MYJ80344.1 cation diffusion facilitator family transporter [Acidimicrobiaceae bacterium]
MAAGGGTKAILAALFANLGLAIAKFVAFVFTGASSMLAEAVHSVADTSNQALLLLGGRLARRGATTQHPFGYGRERYFWSFVVALVLFTVGSLYALYEGIDKIRHPHEIDSPVWAFAVLSVGIVLESFSMRTAVVESNRVRGSAPWMHFIRRSRTPELPVVLLEDLGALLGLVLALGALAIATVFDAPVWDGIGTMSIGVLLGLIAVVLAVEMRSLLLGESATRADDAAVRKAITSTEGVMGLIHLRTQHIGPEELLVAAKVSFDPGYTTTDLVEAINRVEENTRAALPIARIMYVEPDIEAERLSGP